MDRSSRCGEAEEEGDCALESLSGKKDQIINAFSCRFLHPTYIEEALLFPTD